jgi:hypothetical protein
MPVAVPFTVWPEHAEPVTAPAAPAVLVPGVVFTWPGATVSEGMHTAMTGDAAPGMVAELNGCRRTGTVLVVERRRWYRFGLWLALAWATVWR